jgi:DNA-binding HxlR family transcriptional regulator
MEYQKKCKAGLINQSEIAMIQRRLQCVIASLKPASIINPFAPLIDLPNDLPHPRKTLLLLLNFSDTITYFNQYQRESVVNKQTGEIMLKTCPEDIELAFNLLKTSLFRRADELSTNARGFYNWLCSYLKKAETTQFSALDIRKEKRIHPRTLNRYLQELTLFQYIQVSGGNKYREGYQYKITNMGENNTLNNNIERALQANLQQIKAEHEKQANGNVKPETETEQEQPETETQPENTITENITQQLVPINPQAEQRTKRKRIEEKEEHTLKILLELEAEHPQREYLPEDFTAVTGRSFVSEARYLKSLWEQGRLKREWKERKYFYTLATTDSGTAGKSPLTN